MKLLRLRLKNISSFQDEVELDFELPPLSNTNLFAITGPTGAGKSTLLDALCVALYQRTPRLSSRGTTNPSYLLRQGESEGWCEVLFEANGHRYLAEWRTRRTRSGRMQPSARLINAANDLLITERLSAKARAKDDSDRAVSQVVEQLLGLNFESFTRSVLLAQGDFAAFLTAGRDQKRQILEATTGLGIYEQLKLTLNERHAVVRRQREEAERLAQSGPQVTVEDIALVEQQIVTHEEQLRLLTAESQTQETERDEERQRAEAHRRLEATQSALQTLEARREEIARLQEHVESALRASEIREEREAFLTAEAQLQTATERHTQLDKQLEQVEQQAEEARQQLEAAEQRWQQIREESDEARQQIQQAHAEEQSAQQQLDEANRRKQQQAPLTQQIAAAEKALAKHEQERSERVCEVAEAETYLDTHRLTDDAAQQLAEARRLLADLENQRDQLKRMDEEIEAREKRVADLREEDAELSTRLTAGEAALEEATRQLSGAEATLSETRSEGDEEFWRQQRSRAQAAIGTATSFEQNERERTDLQTELVSLQERIGSSREALEELETSSRAASEASEHAEAHVIQLETARDRAQILAQAEALRREHLADGKPCPVCGSLEHPWAEKPGEQEEAPTERQIRAARKRARGDREEAVRLQGELAEANASHQQAVQTLAGAEVRLTEWTQATEPLADAWKRDYGDTPIRVDFVREEMQRAEEKLAQLETSTRNLATAENTQAHVQQEVGHLRNLRERLMSDLQRAQQHCDEGVTERGLLAENAEQIEEQFWLSVPLDYQSKSPARSLDRFEQALTERAKRLEQRTAALHRIEVIDTQIENRRVELLREQQRLEELTGEIDEYQQQAAQLIETARVRTGGLTADAAEKARVERIGKADAARDAAFATHQKAQEARTVCSARWRQAAESKQQAEQALADAEQRYAEQLSAMEFDTVEQHVAAIQSPRWIQAQLATLDAYRSERERLDQTLTELSRTFAEKPFDPEAFQKISERLTQAQQQHAEIQQQLGGLRAEAKRLAAEQEECERRQREAEHAVAEFERWNQLRACIPDNRLRDFALESMFVLLVDLANQQLANLSDRYELEVVNIHEMWVVDRWNAGERRPIETLSGGETFLTSLALALALSELSRGRVRLQSLFLDEGFGTLDAETLDLALSAIEGLRLSGRSVGIISHIEELTHRLPVRIQVRRLGNGTSTVEVQG